MALVRVPNLSPYVSRPEIWHEETWGLDRTIGTLNGKLHPKLSNTPRSLEAYVGLFQVNYAGTDRIAISIGVVGLILGDDTGM